MNILKGHTSTYCNTLLIFYQICYTIGRENPLIYILLWDPLPPLTRILGQQYLFDHHCRFNNCFLSENRSYFNSITEFDVILFNSLQIFVYVELPIPEARSANQIYIYTGYEPPSMYPVLKFYDSFFNYTFTYKLDSDLVWRFFVVRNRTNNIVMAPRENVKWMNFNDMEEINEELKEKLRNKNKNEAAAWLVSHCNTTSKREEFIEKLKACLGKYNLSVGVKGRCVEPNPETPPCNSWNEFCNSWIQSHYFYLAFENSFNEDYVTEKVLTATKNFAIPIVFGDPNYSRFVLLYNLAIHAWQQCHLCPML